MKGLGYLGLSVPALMIGAAMVATHAPAMAADSCSGTAAFDFNSEWDALFATAQAWQFPGTNSCLTSSNGLGSKKLDGKLFQRDGQLWFGLDGGSGTRSELRSKAIQNRDGSVAGKVYVRIPTSGRKFTIAQMLNSTPSLNGGGQDPIVRLEVDNGALDLIFYDRNGSSSMSVNNLLTGLSEGGNVTFQVTQWAGAANDEFDIEVRVNGSIVLSRRKVTGYDSANSYFKAGCYVNTNGGTGCRSSFEDLSFNL